MNGMDVSDTLLLIGKALRHIITKFSSLMIIFLRMCLNGSLMRIDREISFMTRICLSIYRTCFIIVVGLILITGKSRTRK